MTKGIAWETHRGEWETDRLNFSHLSVLRLRTNRWFELLLYSFTSFHSKGERIWYNLKPWKSPHLPALWFHSNSRLSDFLPSCLPLLSLYKYWQNLGDSIEVSLKLSSSCAPFFCLILFVSLFTFCYCLFCAVVWMIVMLKFWMLGFLIGAVFLVQYFVLWCSLNGCCPRILIKKNMLDQLSSFSSFYSQLSSSISLTESSVFIKVVTHIRKKEKG